MVADRGPGTSAVTLIFIVLATVFVAARFFTRIWLVRSVKQDDWWILGAWLFAVGFSASICVGCQYGLGRHQVDIPRENLAALHKADYAFSVLYNPCLVSLPQNLHRVRQNIVACTPSRVSASSDIWSSRYRS